MGQAWGERLSLLPELSVSLGPQEMGTQLPTPPSHALLSGQSHTLFAQVLYRGSLHSERSSPLPCHPRGPIIL